MSSDTSIQSLLGAITTNVNDDVKYFTPLTWLSYKLHMQPSHIFISSLIVLLVLTITGIFQNIFVTLFGMIYPAYMTFKVALMILYAINLKDDTDKKHWLTYWIVFGIMTSLDQSLSMVLFFIPGFYAFKAIFYVWMFYPRTEGAAKIYAFIKPTLTKINNHLNEAITKS